VSGGAEASVPEPAGAGAEPPVRRHGMLSAPPRAGSTSPASPAPRARARRWRSMPHAFGRALAPSFLPIGETGGACPLAPTVTHDRPAALAARAIVASRHQRLGEPRSTKARHP